MQLMNCARVVSLLYSTGAYSPVNKIVEVNGMVGRLLNVVAWIFYGHPAYAINLTAKSTPHLATYVSIRKVISADDFLLQVHRHPPV